MIADSTLDLIMLRYLQPFLRENVLDLIIDLKLRGKEPAAIVSRIWDMFVRAGRSARRTEPLIDPSGDFVPHRFGSVERETTGTNRSQRRARGVTTGCSTNSCIRIFSLRRLQASSSSERSSAHSIVTDAHKISSLHARERGEFRERSCHQPPSCHATCLTSSEVAMPQR